MAANTSKTATAIGLLSVLPYVLGTGTGGWTAEADTLKRQEWRTGTDLAVAQERIAQTASRDTAGFADIVEGVKPAVVGVRASAKQESRDRGPGDSPLGPRSPRSREPRGSPLVPDGPEDPIQVTSQGSGFFVTADGYAVTNRHVVESEKTVEIETDDQKVYRARVVGTDSVSDLALLKVEGRNDFPHVRLADKLPRVGDWILAIGNPFGLGGTVTAGIVSARERNIAAGSYDDLIQIDAPINRGDSGGPTFDLDGNVIGVNTMIFSPTGASVGIAFAVPADTVRIVVDQLRDKGSVIRGWLGVQIQPVTAEIADSVGFERTQGALVAQPQPDGPAAKAGIKSGDIITSLDGQPVENPSGLRKKVGGTAPGTPVKLGLFRKGSETTVAVTLGELPSKADAPAAGRR